MTMTTLTITGGPITNPDGSAASGAFTFVLSTLVNGDWVPTGMVDTATNQIVNPQPVVGQLQAGMLKATPTGGAGYIPLTLLAVDDPTTEPTGLAYLVTEELTAGAVGPWTFRPSHTAVGATVDIASQRPVP